MAYPSSTANKVSNFQTWLADVIATASGATHFTLPSHLPNSLQLLAADEFRERVVVLMDDVVTTGTSFKVGREFLLGAGASVVHCIALGRTTPLPNA